MASIELNIGGHYGKLTVLGLLSEKDKKRQRLWLCQCDCGKIIKVAGSDINSGHKKSCGCFKIQRIKESNTKHGNYINNTTKPEYSAWLHMQTRCYDTENINYKNYGGRGIKVCDRWLKSFENFLHDMGERPSKNHSLDRFPNINGDYEPSNCRWATDEQQRRGKRNNHWIEYNGEKKIISDWSKQLGTESKYLYHFLKKHSFEEAIVHFKNKQLWQ